MMLSDTATITRRTSSASLSRYGRCTPAGQKHAR